MKMLFRDFVTAYMAELSFNSPLGIPEPMVICDEDRRYLFATDWHILSDEDLRSFVSKKIYNSYVEKFFLADGRIQVCIVDKLEEEEKEDETI